MSRGKDSSGFELRLRLRDIGFWSGPAQEPIHGQLQRFAVSTRSIRESQRIGAKPAGDDFKAERFLEEFRERLAKFGLELHAEKTRLIEFGYS
jgi:hypothetical protein